MSPNNNDVYFPMPSPRIANSAIVEIQALPSPWQREFAWGTKTWRFVIVMILKKGLYDSLRSFNSYLRIMLSPYLPRIALIPGTLFSNLRVASMWRHELPKREQP